MTAVEWLQDKWSNCKEWKWQEIQQWFEQAKEMEKQLMQDFGARCCLMTKQKNQWTLEGLYNDLYGSKGSDETLKENHIVDTNEMIDQVPDVRKMVDDDVEKLELDYYKELEERREVAKNFQGQVAGRHPDMFGHSEMHHMVRGYVEGYNKAKETLYTEEDMIKCWKYASIDNHQVFGDQIGDNYISFIQSLKQPKKD